MYALRLKYVLGTRCDECAEKSKAAPLSTKGTQFIAIALGVGHAPSVLRLRLSAEGLFEFGVGCLYDHLPGTVWHQFDDAEIEHCVLSQISTL
jgi:hypothetical protein